MIDFPYRIPFRDTDASGRIHWASVFSWVEAAEHELLRRHGVDDPSPYPRRAAEVAYLLPLGAGDEVVIHLEPARAGTTSVTWTWRIERDGETCIEGGHTVVHVDDDGTPAPWPEELRAAGIVGDRRHTPSHGAPRSHES